MKKQDVIISIIIFLALLWLLWFGLFVIELRSHGCHRCGKVLMQPKFIGIHPFSQDLTEKTFIITLHNGEVYNISVENISFFNHNTGDMCFGNFSESWQDIGNKNQNTPIRPKRPFHVWVDDCGFNNSREWYEMDFEISYILHDLTDGNISKKDFAKLRVDK